MGWTHETWKAVLQMSHGRPLLREILTLYACGELGRQGEDLLNSSLVIPLCKNSAGTAIRPIAVPTAFRECCARAVIALHRQDLTEAAGPHQFAAMMPDGARCVANHLRTQTSPAPQTQVFVRTDIRNAFNEIDRQHVLASLESANPLLAASQFCWLHRPTTAFMQANEGTRRILHTNVRIPQEDPLSSLAFAVAMGPPLNKVHAEGYKPFAHTDDTVIASEPGKVHDALRAWQRHLQATGLRSRPPFTGVLLGPGPESAPRSAFWAILGTCLGVPQRVLFECFLAFFGPKKRQKTLKKHSLGHSEAGAQNCPKSTSGGTFRPGP